MESLPEHLRKSYVVAPPSQHIDGGYKWQNGLYRPAKLPDDLRDLLLTPRTHECKGLPPCIEEGERNDTLFKFAGKLRGEGLGHDKLLEQLQVENNKRCFPPLEGPELKLIVQGVMKKEPGNSSALHRWREEINHDPKFTHGDKVSLFTLAEHADSTTLKAHPSQDTVANKGHVGRTTVSKAFTKATQMGYLERYKKSNENNPGVHYVYRLTFPPCISYWY